LYVEESGTAGAPTIVFLHGVGASGWMWKPQTAALADFHLLTIDLPGHGKSNGVEWVSAADTTAQIAEIIRTRAAAGRAHVVGLSLGGYIALTLVEHYAEVVDRVVVSGITISPMPGKAWLNAQVWFMANVMQRRWFATMQAKALPLNSAMQADFVENLMKMSAQAYRRIVEEMVDYAVPDVLHQRDTPTLVVAGSRESAVIRQAVAGLPQMMPHARGCFAPGVRHGWNVEAPQLFSAMVRAWVDGSPLPQSLQGV
jgi:pimeloyl-ACP methyl ester carboxylesterase